MSVNHCYRVVPDKTISFEVEKFKADTLSFITVITHALSILFFILALSFSVQANEKVNAKMPAVYQQCVSCHGDVGQGNNLLNAPVLAGLSETYLTRQLANFKSGLRGSHAQDTFGKQMQPFAKALDLNKDVPLLVAYLADLPTVDIKQAAKGNLKNGSRYYQGKCGACHGGVAQGNEAMKAPKLAHQHTEYLRRQMKNFTTGLRGNHANDKYGRQMAMMAKTTSGKELEDILYFIAMQK